jgi:hypothetical protein
MRSSIVAGAIGCELFEVVDGELKFIGQLPTGNKVAYQTTPGDKVFMAYGTAADFMLAKLAGGKTYYSIVRPNWGTGGFAPTPIRRASPDEPSFDGKEFKEWDAATKRLEPNERGTGLVPRQQGAHAADLRRVLEALPDQDRAREALPHPAA